jgi:anti-sigma28 factor (negative regulator of flagellin synthesis)
MRIDPKASIAPTTLDPAASAPAKSTPKPEPSAVVTLSSAATVASATGPTIAERLDKLRALVAKGEYPLDLDKLASRIVDDDLVRGGK